MSHAAINQIQKRIEAAKNDSDFTYFHALLLSGEALFKTTVLGFIAALAKDPDRHRYRLKYKLLRADGLGTWSAVLDDALTGPASQFLLADLSQEKNELTRLCGAGTWQFESIGALKQCLDELGIEVEDLPTQTDMKRWFTLFADLRNKTRGHGATLPNKVSGAIEHLAKSISLFHNRHSLFKRQWAYLYRNLSGKYKILPITEKADLFDDLKKNTEKSYPNGVYLFVASPRLVPFLESDGDLTDFFFPNGGFGKKTFEYLSYATDSKKEGDGSSYLTLPGKLPPSETQGLGQLEQLWNCFSNAPQMPKDYVARPLLEEEIKKLTADERHPIITLRGRGGIGKTSLALKVLNQLATGTRFDALFWFSARDVDLQFTGPKPVKPHVLSPEEVSRFYVSLVSPERLKESGFRCREFFESQLNKSEIGPCLYVFDNFETTQNPEELFLWIDTYIRLPSKVLITTRLRDFKGDYPVEVGGMTESEAEKLIATTAHYLGVKHLLNPPYIAELIQQAEGHPYVIKILLGEVAKEKYAGHIPRLVAGRDEILTALFERTYASLSPCAQRAFMTLSGWNSAVPRVALEAVLCQSIGEIVEIEKAIDVLLQYSLAESQKSVEGLDFISLPLVATVFGKKKLNISQLQAGIKVDIDLLQMLGPVNRGDIHFSLAKRIDHFLGNIARRMEKGDPFDKYASIVEMIGRHFPPAWLSLARLHMEQDLPESFETAKHELRRYLEQDSVSTVAAAAWLQLAQCCEKTGDLLGQVHALIQRAKIQSVPFTDLSSAANHLNYVFRIRADIVDEEAKQILAQELFEVMEQRHTEALADDYGQMAWLALRLKKHEHVTNYIQSGLKLDPDNYHLNKLLEHSNVSI
jgi:hypothetical protein